MLKTKTKKTHIIRIYFPLFQVATNHKQMTLGFKRTGDEVVIPTFLCYIWQSSHNFNFQINVSIKGLEIFQHYHFKLCRSEKSREDGQQESMMDPTRVLHQIFP